MLESLNTNYLSAPRSLTAEPLKHVPWGAFLGHSFIMSWVASSKIVFTSNDAEQVQRSDYDPVAVDHLPDRMPMCGSALQYWTLCLSRLG